ncbi:MAG: bifunctional UDP-N-acetylglucosamine diphosphorylase/glucosamine-1-phosphate N-acetyltransferase GlmU [Tissierellia bacterium]|nr:bifunctional UDP-N-acetylglucosamine diphosphorylase/glucosamine-1-phosphate N-acetyltransferase GlmU [Tissierellia bacterium]
MKISIVLAAGEGTRMKSKLPKVLHPVAGKPMLGYIVDSCKDCGIDKTIVIVGYGSEKVKKVFADSEVIFRDQPVGEGIPYGTGFAVKQAINDFEDEDTVIILTGDTPLIQSETLDSLIKERESGNYAALVLTAIQENPFGYGRIIRGENSNIVKIVEEKDANDKEKAVNEVNSGIFAFRGEDLKNALGKLSTDNSQGELYLTDVIKILVEERKKVGAHILRNAQEMLGVNSKVQLAICEGEIRQNINNHHMLNGVTILDPRTTIIESEVEIGSDTVIYPGAILQGRTVIGKDCTIYGTTRVVDSTIGDHVILDNVLVEESSVGDGSKLGPYAHLRPKSQIGKNTKIGNFVEVKNSVFGDGSKAGHLAYIGDADIGKDVNIGCGTIFVNYNGAEKFRTSVGDRAFIGSNSNLVAPLVVEEDGYIAAGSTITRKVEKGQLSIERSRQKNLNGWVEKKGLKKK